MTWKLQELGSLIGKNRTLLFDCYFLLAGSDMEIGRKLDYISYKISYFGFFKSDLSLNRN